MLLASYDMIIEVRGCVCTDNVPLCIEGKDGKHIITCSGHSLMRLRGVCVSVPSPPHNSCPVFLWCTVHQKATVRARTRFLKEWEPPSLTAGNRTARFVPTATMRQTPLKMLFETKTLTNCINTFTLL